MTGVATAPASSANLGPGFDSLAIAFEIRCRVQAEMSDRWVIAERGEEFEPNEGDLVVRAVKEAVGRPMRLTIANDIPRSRGLGSSAAVTAAAACAAARATGGDPTPDELFALVSRLEGHPDNAAAAVHGGLVMTRGEAWRHLELHSSLRFVVGVPDRHLSTTKARATLPAAVRHSAAARNVARMGMLIEGLRTGDPEALRLASGDELHERHRAELSPMTGAIMDAAVEAGAYHAAWSGAGPTAIAVTDEPHIADVVAAIEKALDGAGNVIQPEVAVTGLS